MTMIGINPKLKLMKIIILLFLTSCSLPFTLKKGEKLLIIQTAYNSHKSSFLVYVPKGVEVNAYVSPIKGHESFKPKNKNLIESGDKDVIQFDFEELNNKYKTYELVITRFGIALDSRTFSVFDSKSSKVSFVVLAQNEDELWSAAFKLSPQLLVWIHQDTTQVPEVYRELDHLIPIYHEREVKFFAGGIDFISMPIPQEEKIELAAQLSNFSEHPAFFISSQQYFGAHHQGPSFEGLNPQAFELFIEELKKRDNSYAFISGGRPYSEIMQFPRSLTDIPTFEFSASGGGENQKEFDQYNPWRVTGSPQARSYLFIKSILHQQKWEINVKAKDSNNNDLYSRKLFIPIKFLQQF